MLSKPTESTRIAQKMYVCDVCKKGIGRGMSYLTLRLKLGDNDYRNWKCHHECRRFLNEERGDGLRRENAEKSEKATEIVGTQNTDAEPFGDTRFDNMLPRTLFGVRSEDGEGDGE